MDHIGASQKVSSDVRRQGFEPGPADYLSAVLAGTGGFHTANKRPGIAVFRIPIAVGQYRTVLVSGASLPVQKRSLGRRRSSKLASRTGVARNICTTLLAAGPYGLRE